MKYSGFGTGIGDRVLAVIDCGIRGNMTEAVTGNRRRLPSWMLQANNADKQKKPSNAVEKCSLSEEPTKTDAARSKIKPVVRNNDKSTQEEEIKQQVESLQVYEARQRTKKATGREKISITSSTASRGAKRKHKKGTIEYEETVNESITHTDQHVKSKRPKKNEVNSQEKSDEDISLTVEDLMSIAEEYVSSYNEKQHERLTIRENTSTVNHSRLSISRPTGGTPQAGGSSQTLSNCINSRCSSLSCEKEGTERGNHITETFGSNFTSTGDVAQDMLSLYLGPFLKKTSCEDQNFRPTESKALEVVHELNHHVGSSAILEEDIPVKKKKSSLKDKVSMFFE